MIDGRMLFFSGIGRYLREILQRKAAGSPPISILCNSTEQQAWITQFVPTARAHRVTAAVYSGREQFLACGLPKHVTYWVPHFNVPWICRCRLVATVHDLAPLALPDLFGGRLQQYAAKFYFRKMRRIQQIITVSRFTRRELETRQLAASERIAVIPNGVSSFWLEGAPSVVGNGRLLYVGNLKPHKNLGRLIEGLALARRQQPIELDIVGRIDGFRAGLTNALLNKLRSTPWIRLLGEISDEALRLRYREAQALIFPSLYEGFGLPILEAMAAGCPILSSNAGALQEISGASREAGGAVDYFDPHSVSDIAAAIIRTAAVSPHERCRLQILGRTIASSYSWDRAAAATWSLLAPLAVA